MISGTAAKRVLEVMVETGESPRQIIDRLDLWLAPPELIRDVAYQTVVDNPELVISYINGSRTVLNVLIGKVMKSLSGKAIASDVENLVRASIEYLWSPWINDANHTSDCG